MNIQPTSLDAYRLMHDGVLALARAERAGIRCDVNYIESTKIRLTRKIERLEKQLESSDFYKQWERSIRGKMNLYSDTQLRDFLYTTKKLTPIKTTVTGKGSTDEEALIGLGIPELNSLLQIRKLKKNRDTYLDGFLREQINGYIHPFFNLNLVVSYRSSSDHPNFQNIPIRDEESKQLVRKALFPRPGHQLLEMDYSGLEFNINACYSKDPVMVQYCNDPTSDIHADIAKQVFLLKGFDKSIPDHKVLRSAAKNGFVFPQLYGDYYKNCATNLSGEWGGLGSGRWKAGQGLPLDGSHLSDHLIKQDIHSLNDYEDHIKDVQDAFFSKFSVHAKYMAATHRKYSKLGYVDLHTGFQCGGMMSKNKVLNYPVQGAAFHCLLWSFIELDGIMRKEGWKSRLIGQIHDSIVFDIYPPELETVLRIIKRVTCSDLPKAWPWIIVPLNIEAEVCDVDSSWADKKKIAIP